MAVQRSQNIRSAPDHLLLCSLLFLALAGGRRNTDDQDFSGHHRAERLGLHACNKTLIELLGASLYTTLSLSRRWRTQNADSYSAADHTTE